MVSAARQRELTASTLDGVMGTALILTWSSDNGATGCTAVEDGGRLGIAWWVRVHRRNEHWTAYGGTSVGGGVGGSR